MNDPIPHYLLLTETSRTAGFGRWRFNLRPADGSVGIDVADVEPETWGERLDLLTVVRALESLDQPSRVTLVGCTRYVEQGIQYGLAEWRDNQWRWDYFGQTAPVRDADLWQRMDRVLNFHQVNCGQRRLDAGHAVLAGPHWAKRKSEPGGKWADRIAGGKWLEYTVPLLAAWCAVWIETASRFWQMSARTMAGYSPSFLVHRS